MAMGHCARMRMLGEERASERSEESGFVRQLLLTLR